MNRQVGFECQLCREWYFLRARFEAHLVSEAHEAAKLYEANKREAAEFQFRGRYDHWPFTSFKASDIKGG